MKNLSSRVLLFFVLVLAASCNIFHSNTADPYSDLTSDHLQHVKVNAIRIFIPDTVTAYPGASFPIGVIAVTNHKELKTRGICNGYVNWNSYSVQVEGGSFDKGIVTVNANPQLSNGNLKISITPNASPGLKQEIKLPLSYKRIFIANCKGQKGINGFAGLSGAELHQLDTTEKHHVYNGRRGQAGSDGQTGSDGCVADVFVKAVTVSGKKLMSVLVINHCDNSHSVFWVDPDGGSLIVDVSGGDGGNGGNGGDGENGVDGTGASSLYTTVTPQLDRYNQQYYKYGVNYMDLSIDSTLNPTGNGGTGGIGGNGGRGGFGGNGGVAIIHLDSSAVEWKNKIIVDNSGGKPGKPGLGGYAGRGGNGAYLMSSKKNGDYGYIGAEGIKGNRGQAGSATIWRIEKVEMKW